MPLAVQVHHAAADGFHVSRLLDEVQELFMTPDWLVKGRRVSRERLS
jgi:chloramphenicol O-acetyltransferase type A